MAPGSKRHILFRTTTQRLMGIVSEGEHCHTTQRSRGKMGWDKRSIIEVNQLVYPHIKAQPSLLIT